MPDYKKSWYCDQDQIQNCFIRFSLKDADGKVLAQDHVWPMGLGAMKADWQPNLRVSVSPNNETLEFESGKIAVAKVRVENVRDGKSVPSIFTSLTLDGAIKDGSKQ